MAPSTLAEGANDVVKTRFVPVSNGTALGANSHVGHDHSTAVGAGSQTDRANQVVLGTEDDEVTVRNLTKNTATKEETAGIVVHKADGTLASDGGRLQNEVDAKTVGVAVNSANITTLQNENVAQWDAIDNNTSRIDAQDVAIDKLNGRVDEAFEGVAMALAMESPQVDPGKVFGISLNYGNFEGEHALAAAAKVRFDDTWSGTAGLGYGMGSNTLGVRAGVQAQW